MDDSRPREGTQLGDYYLEKLISENATTQTWLAHQASINRAVILTELRPTKFDAREAFLSDVRAQAAVDHPLIGSVYEAVSNDEHCFAAFEQLPGVSLAKRLSTGEGLKPVQIAHILRRIAEAAMTLEAAGTATSPMVLKEIFLDSHGVIRLGNLARSGERQPTQSTADIMTLGSALQPLVAGGRPGESRVRTVLAWMRGEELDRTLTWEEVRSYAEQIEQQLAETPSTSAPPTSRAQSKKKSTAPVIIGIFVLAGIAVAAIALRGRGGNQNSIPLPAEVEVAAGEHPLWNGGSGTLEAFPISSHEVTIGEYEEFLKFLASLPEKSRNAYDDKEQPEEKLSHEPDEWVEMLAAAKAGGQWQGRVTSLDCPIVGVDWWDAAAYCDWRDFRLPTEDEWYAALRVDLPNPATLRPAGWGNVQEAPPTDRTPSGLLGMAGSVAEWTSSRSINPANPLGTEKWVIAGGSYLKPAGGATRREWTEDRNQRRTDLGFRVIKQAR